MCTPDGTLAFEFTGEMPDMLWQERFWEKHMGAKHLARLLPP